MSTAAETQPISKLDALRHGAWNVVYGLYWAALALLLLSLWTFTKYWETMPLVGWGLLVLFVVALGFGTIQCLQLRALGRLKPEEQERQLVQKQSQGPMVILALSALLLLFMLVLLFSVENKLAAFPIVSSGILLALIGGLAGVLLLAGQERKFGQQQILETMVQARKPFMTACLIIGGILFVGGFWVFFSNRASWTGVFPQGAGLMLLGLVFLGIGLWDMLATNREVNVANMRVLVLVAGGTAGLIIALMTALRAYMWMDVVGGGMPAWQGDRAWQLWVCIWLELLGLGLMFGSLYLAQADIRFNPILRRLLYGYNAVFTGLLVLAALVVLNIVVYASFPYKANWTAAQGFYALSDSSKNVLSKLKKPTTIWIVMSQGSRDYTDVKNLLENCQAYTNQLYIREISPDRDPKEYQRLVQRFSKLQESSQAFHKTAGRGLLLAFGYDPNRPPPEGERVPHAFIPAGELSDDTGGMGKKANPDQVERRHEFKGEDLVMTQLKFLEGGETKPTICFTQSNGESDIKNKANFPEASGLFADKLESSNYEVKQLFFGVEGSTEKAGKSAIFTKKTATGTHKIPTDVKVVLIVWPKTPFAKDQLEALEEYMKKGGKLIVASSMANEKYRLLPKTNLEGFLKKFSVDMAEDFLIQFNLGSPNVETVTVKANQRSDNPIARAFDQKNFQFLYARTVKPMPPAGGGGYKAETIFEVPIEQGSTTWAESDMNYLSRPDLYVINLLKTNKLHTKAAKEPIPVVVAVTNQETPRLVVFGDGDLTSNPLAGTQFFDVVLSSVEWLGERPQNIGITPKKSNFYVLPVQNISRNRMILLPFGLMVVGLIGIGMGVWVVRRP